MTRLEVDQERELARQHARHKQEQNRAPLMIPTPRVACEKKRAKWFGMPPTSVGKPPARSSELRF